LTGSGLLMEAATVRERSVGEDFPNPFKHPSPPGNLSKYALS